MKKLGRAVDKRGSNYKFLREVVEEEKAVCARQGWSCVNRGVDR